jgi:hypothetical protein
MARALRKLSPDPALPVLLFRALPLSMRFWGRSAGFWLCEAVHARVEADVVLTFCNA